MKKLLAITALTVAALALVPVASASANTFTGVCSVTGNAVFGLPLTLSPQNTTYNFANDTNTTTNTCTGQLTTLSGTTNLVNDHVTASAGGSGSLSCATSHSTGGTGKLTFSGGAVVNFNIDLDAAGSEVVFSLTGTGTPPGSGEGHATFAVDPTKAPQCVTPGLSSINFAVQAVANALNG